VWWGGVWGRGAGHYFATCSHDRTARLWSTDHIYPLRIFAGDCTCRLCAGERLIEGCVRVWWCDVAGYCVLGSPPVFGFLTLG